MEFEVASLTNKLNAILAELQSKAPCPIVAESDIRHQPSDIFLQPSDIRHQTSSVTHLSLWHLQLILSYFLQTYEKK